VFAADAIATPPAAALLQAGDLIWPKKPGTIVPYNSRPGEADKSDALRWRNEREAYLDQIRHNPNPSPQEKERYSALQKMTYEEFASYYLGDRIPGQPATYGLGDIAVGHVGIIEITDGRPFVVEAMIGPGVRRLSYADWLRDRPGEFIWVGRLRGVPPEKRAAVAECAAKQIGKPYKFFDFDLEDASGFYCSKLAWLSVRLGAGFPPDDDPNPNRMLWYSPKQLMKSNHIELIVNPGDYGSRE
jgi:Permuted papain-like amidase enzyme, YaeF/YiiX, C92 family